MAFQTTASAPVAAPVAVANFEKAAGFLNIYLPSKDGKRRKVGAIALRDSKALEKQIREYVEADEKNLGKMTKKLVIEYQSAQLSEGATLDLA